VLLLSYIFSVYTLFIAHRYLGLDVNDFGD